jgi:hypothetical protein
MTRRYRRPSPITRYGLWITRQREDSENPGGDIWLAFYVQKRAVKSERMLKKYPHGFQLVDDNNNRPPMYKVSREEEQWMRDNLGYTRHRKPRFLKWMQEHPEKLEDFLATQDHNEAMWQGIEVA